MSDCLPFETSAHSTAPQPFPRRHSAGRTRSLTVRRCRPRASRLQWHGRPSLLCHGSQTLDREPSNSIFRHSLTMAKGIRLQPATLASIWTSPPLLGFTMLAGFPQVLLQGRPRPALRDRQPTMSRRLLRQANVPTSPIRFLTVVKSKEQHPSGIVPRRAHPHWDYGGNN